MIVLIPISSRAGSTGLFSSTHCLPREFDDLPVPADAGNLERLKVRIPPGGRSEGPAGKFVIEKAVLLSRIPYRSWVI